MNNLKKQKQLKENSLFARDSAFLIKVKCSLFIVLLLLTGLKSFATHIVGGEIFYNALGGNNYHITLKLYRDCSSSSNAFFDDPVTIFIFNGSGNFVDSIEIPFPGSIILPVTINNPCFTPPTNVCVEEAVYETDVFLPPVSGGYDIDYQRCCRNSSILNLISPGDVGSTYMAHIPDASSAINNSSPHYINFPPIFLCSGVPLNFDHKAIDADGDSLYYELCDPFTGLNSNCPTLGIQAIGGCPSVGSPPPYAAVPWLSPYSASYPISSSPALYINPQSGYMTGTPDMLGQWVVGVCVSEYRNGVLLDINKRDFQFNVVDCPNLPVASIPQQTQFCSGYTVNFTQNSVNALNYHWDFGDLSTNTDTSNSMSPAWTYADSGQYTVSLIINPQTMCADTQTNTFNVYPLLAPSFTPPAGECVYNNSFDFIGGGAFMGNGTVNWSFGNQATPSVSSQFNPVNIVFNSAGVYPIIFTINENGCTKSVMDSVHVYPKPMAQFGLESEIGCVLNPVYFADSSFSSSLLSYNWSFGNGETSILQNPAATYAAVGVYTIRLIITSQNGCKDTAYLPNPLTINPSPIAGFTLTPDNTSIFEPDISIVDQSEFASTCKVVWGDGLNSLNCDSVHHFQLPGTYTVTQIVVNNWGCYDTAYAQVIIRPEFVFWIPNAFTPDRNDLNETFGPKVIGAHDYTFVIFNRWGQKLFETSNPEEGWNGYYQTNLCSNDIYVYKITLLDDVENNFHQYIGKVVLVN